MNRLGKLLSAVIVAGMLGGAAAAQEPSPLLQVLQEELQRSMKAIQAKGEVPAWYLSYTVTEIQRQTIEGELGAIHLSSTSRQRVLDIDIRVGNKPGESRPGMSSRYGGLQVELPLDDDINAIRRALWLNTDGRYRLALRELRISDAKQSVDPDPLKQTQFSLEAPQHQLLAATPAMPPTQEAEERVRQLSALFRKYPQILSSRVMWRWENVVRYEVNSEGTQLQIPRHYELLGVDCSTRADDGMVLNQFDNVENEPGLSVPSLARSLPVAQKVADDLMRLRNAPVMDAYAGPAIFSGRAAAVFFHENLGHRVEGTRQDDQTQGHTFTNKLYKAIMPPFISVVDDPTLEKLGDIQLNGHYAFDEEGVPAQKVSLVSKGVLQNYLLSRSLVGGFKKSNGHGRSAPGHTVMARQGNLMVSASQTVSNAELRKKLVEECRRQGKPYGLYFEQVSGGSTYVGGGQPQIYQVHPLLVYRVFADGKPDQLVRGVEIIGTPLAAFLNIKACSDRQEVFNGVCGAESGLVPVAAIAPSMLISQIETQKESWQPRRFPVLPTPTQEERQLHAR